MTPSDITITKRERVRGRDGSPYWRFHGAVHGALIRDSINIPVESVDAMTPGDLTRLAQRQLMGLAKYMDEQEQAHAR